MSRKPRPSAKGTMTTGASRTQLADPTRELHLESMASHRLLGEPMAVHAGITTREERRRRLEAAARRHPKPERVQMELEALQKLYGGST